MQQLAEPKTRSGSRQNQKSQKIEDVVKPNATMRLHQRLFDRHRGQHIDVKELGEDKPSPGKSLSAYLVSPKYRKPHKQKSAKPVATTALITTPPSPVIQYSQITRDIPAYKDLVVGLVGHTRSFKERIIQRYQVFRSQHKPFVYSLTSGANTSWLSSPRAKVALAGSALAILLFFTGSPFTPKPTGPDNPAGEKSPIVIKDASQEKREPTQLPAASIQTPGSPGAPSSAPPPSTSSGGAGMHTSTSGSAPIFSEPQPSAPLSGGRGSGPSASPAPTVSPTPAPSAPLPQSPVPVAPPAPTAPLIQDIVKPTPITIPGQDVIVDDTRIIKADDINVLIN